MARVCSAAFSLTDPASARSPQPAALSPQPSALSPQPAALNHRETWKATRKIESRPSRTASSALLVECSSTAPPPLAPAPAPLPPHCTPRWGSNSWQTTAVSPTRNRAISLITPTDAVPPPAPLAPPSGRGSTCATPRPLPTTASKLTPRASAAPLLSGPPAPTARPCSGVRTTGSAGAQRRSERVGPSKAPGSVCVRPISVSGNSRRRLRFAG